LSTRFTQCNSDSVDALTAVSYAAEPNWLCKSIGQRGIHLKVEDQRDR
jgi:hypothetical protein